MTTTNDYQQLKRMIDELRDELVTINNEKSQVTKTLDQLQAEQKENDVYFQDKIQKIQAEWTTSKLVSNEKQATLKSSKYQLQNKYYVAQEKIEDLTGKLAGILEKQALAEQLNALSKEIEELAKETVWFEKAANFQHEDIAFTVNAYKQGLSGVLNANQMGTGKTLETVAASFILNHLFEQEFGRKARCLWLTKKSLMESNVREMKKWDGTKFAAIVKGDAATRQMSVEFALQTNSLVVANYESVRTTPLIRKTNWDFIYCDEVQKLKGGSNPSGPTQIWKDVKELCSRAKFLIFLSGTPIGNHPDEVWAYLNIFEPQRFPTLRKFQREYTAGWGEEGVHVDFTKLITTLKQQAFRRTKKEVGIQLPDKTREFRYLEMNGEQRALYDEMRTNFFIWLDSEKSNALSAAAIIAQLTRLRQIASFPGAIKIKTEDGQTHSLECNESVKIDECMEIITELLNENEQVVVFSSQFNGPLDEIKRRMQVEFPSVGVEVLKGENSADVANIEKRFQDGQTKVLCVNMKTGSEGLNLQKNPEAWVGGASHAIMIDLWYSPSVNEQAEDRLHRIGATENVSIHILQTEDSVDSFIAAMLEKKSAMMQGIIESDELRSPSDWKAYLSDKI